VPEPGLIAEYLGVLAGQLPGPVVEELADGLDGTYRHYLRLGLAPDAAATAAVAEFGDPELIVAQFTRAHPARRAARALLAIGPAVGACWALALVTAHARTWPVPTVVRLTAGLALVSCVVLLAVAVLGTRYRLVARAGIGGCAGFAALDAAMIIGALVAAPVLSPAAIMAMTVSAGRFGLSIKTLRASLVTG
jgi:hypothetical protein